MQYNLIFSFPPIFAARLGMTDVRRQMTSVSCQVSFFRDVAQPGSAHVWGAWGRKFKSCHPD